MKEKGKFWRKNVGKAVGKKRRWSQRYYWGTKNRWSWPDCKRKTDKDEKSTSANVHTEKIEKSGERLEKENFYEQFIRDNSKWSMTLEK